MAWLFIILHLLVQLAAAHGPYEHFKSSWKAHTVHVELDPAISLNTNLTEFKKNREAVLVSWDGVSNPESTDMIALYVPANANPRFTVPVHWVNCSDVDTKHLLRGSGSASFNLLNMRGSFGFKLVRGGKGGGMVRPTVVAEAAPIANTIPASPTSGHLALHEDGISLVAQWISASADPQAVQWGPEPGWAARGGHYRYNATSAVSTYKRTDMCGYPANATGWLDPGYIHTAVMRGVRRAMFGAMAHQWFRFGSERDGWSDDFQFRAPIPTRPPGPPPPRAASANDAAAFQAPASLQAAAAGVDVGAYVPTVFLAFADVAMSHPILFNDPWAGGLHFADGYGENASRLAGVLGSHARERDAALALLLGDLAYALGYGADWDVFGQQWERAFTRWPLMTAIGNHERDWPGTGDAFNNTARDSGGECGVPYAARYYTPPPFTGEPRGPRTSYYSFNAGPVHFLLLDSESPGGPGSPQGRFAAADLAAVNRSVTPWVVVGLHRMMAAPATWRRKLVGDLDVMERLMAEYEDLFLAHVVDVVIQGHEHAYARTCPLAHGTCAADVATTPQQQGRTDSEQSGGRQLRADVRERGAAGRMSAAAAGDGDGEAAEGGVRGCLQSGRAGGPARAYAGERGGPVYLLTGHGGAGFTWGFPPALPPWVEAGAQGVNGYLRFTATRTYLRVEAVVAGGADDGAVMDSVQLAVRPKA